MKPQIQKIIIDTAKLQKIQLKNIKNLGLNKS